MTLRAVSYGGGVQSTALLVLAARGTPEARALAAVLSIHGPDREGWCAASRRVGYLDAWPCEEARRVLAVTEPSGSSDE